MKTNWSNKSPPKYAIQLFISQNVIFTCNTCIHNNNENTPIHLHTNCLCGSVANASDTQAVGHGFDPRPDH